MIKVENNKDISQYLTMKVGAQAQFFTIVKTKDDLLEAIDFARDKNLPIFILGGGSNTVVTKNLSALVVKNEITGFDVVSQDDTEVIVEAMSGESWMRLVHFITDEAWYGAENLASIYGTVGAAPIQNIGAYGVELLNIFDSLLAIDLKSKEEKIFKLEDCHFGYRDSIFKREAKGKYFIYSVKLKLKKQASLNLDYDSISEKLAQQGIKNPRPAEVAKIISEIRLAKLPTPAVLPNAGSFFKNPEISQKAFDILKESYPDIPGFVKQDKGLVKLPAAWLIEKAGFKGKQFGPVGMYEKQALIMVNYGEASGQDIMDMINRVKTKVHDQFAIDLDTEVNII